MERNETPITIGLMLSPSACFNAADIISDMMVIAAPDIITLNKYTAKQT